MRLEEFENRLLELIVPSATDVLRAKSMILGIVKDGESHSTKTLLSAVSDAEGVHLPEGGGLIVGKPTADISTIDGDDPVLAFYRYRFAAAEAVGDLVASGLIIASHKGREGETETTQETYAIPYSFGSLGASVDVIPGIPRLSGSYRLPHAERSRTWEMASEVDLFTSDLTSLHLGAPGKRALKEGLQAFRRGLYLAAAAMIGAAVESAWYEVGKNMESSYPKLADLITKGETAKVERYVSDRLRETSGVKDEAFDLFAHADYVRRLRNYGAHPTTNDTALGAHLSESGIGLLIQQTHSHLARLGRAANAWNEHHEATSSNP